MNLYEIAQNFQTVLMGDPETGEIDEAALDALGGSLEEKADNYAKYIADLEGEIAGIDKELARLTDMKNSRKAKIAFLKQHLQQAMVATGKTKFKTKLFSFGIARNGGKIPVTITDDVPKSWCKVKYDPDKDKIREALESGKKLRFASLGERGEHLTIK